MTKAEEESASSPSADELSPPDEATLWLVSFADDDDREMRAPEIASALRRGEIRAETIVWREGLPEWIALSSVPLLAKLLVNTGETRTAPVAVAKIPLVQREQTTQAKPTNSATATPIGLAGPSSTAETPAPTPAWKGRTRIGIPRMDTGTPGATTETAEKPATRSAVGTPLPTSAKPAPQVKSGAAASPTTTPLATSVAKQTPDPAKQDAGATQGKLSPVEPKRPEPWTLDPKLGAKPGTPRPGGAAPRTSVPKAAPAPSVKITDGTPAAPKTTDTPSPSAEATTAPVPAAVPASSPKAAEAPAAAVPASSPKAAEAPVPATAAEASPEAAAVPVSPAPKAASPSPTPPSAAVSPVTSKAASPAPPTAAPASPEPPKAAEAKAEPQRRKPDAPKGPPPRVRDVARAPAVKRDTAPVSARRGSANIWEDDEAVSVDPESVRPPPPVHAIAEARATGPLGVKKKAPKPPSPKLKPRPEPVVEPADTDNSIPMPDFEADVNLAKIVSEAPAAPVAQLSLPLVTEFAETPATPMVDTTPTVPRDVKDPAASKATVVSTAPSAPPAEKRRSLFPLVVIGAAAGVSLMFALKRQAPSEPVPTAPEPPRTAEPAQPTNAVVTPTPPAEPEPPASASAEAPAPSQSSGAAAATAKPALSPGTTKPSGATTQVVTPGQSTAAPKEPKPEATTAPTTEKKPAPVAEQPQVDDVGGEFDKAAASAALGAAASSAAGCRKEGDPTGVAVVHVTFSNAGRATRAVVEGPPFAGTATGGCIAEALRRVKIPPYGGDRVTVTKRVVIQ